MNLADNTMIYFGEAGLVLTFVNEDSTPITLEKNSIIKKHYLELYKHLNEGKSVWEFENRRVIVYDDPLDIVDLLSCEFHALASEDNISEVIMQGIADTVILQNMEKLQEVGK